MQPENEPPTKPAQEHPPSWTPSRVSSLAVVAMVLACLPCPRESTWRGPGADGSEPYQAVEAR